MNQEQPSGTGAGLQRVISPHSFSQTLARLQQAIHEHGLTLFARIDFTGDAAKAGLQMQPAQLLVFGSPKAGTPLMVAAPTLAIDLPLKILVWEDVQRRVWLTYNEPEYLLQRHSVPREFLQNLSGVAALARSVAQPQQAKTGLAGDPADKAA
jgi:uncharacterized protein (DUF302 family)